MLITFTSKAAAEVTMYKEHAKRILDLLHKDMERGVITAEEAPRAVALLEGEIEESRKHQVSEQVERDVAAHHSDDKDDNDHEAIELVTFSTRAYPLLEMLRSAKNEKTDVLWGV